VFRPRHSGTSLIAAAAIFWGVFSATAANANIIEITPQDDASNHNVVTVSTTGSIIGLLCGAAGGTTAECPPTVPVGSLTAATGFAPFPVSGGNPQDEADFLETIVGGTFTGGASQVGPGNTFTVASGIFTIKQDGWLAFLFNAGSGPITLNISGAGTEGISHSTVLSGLTPTQFSAVPGPIAGAGLPGLIAACGGLIAFARRRRQRIV
jgi:hypothetical protein